MSKLNIILTIIVATITLNLHAADPRAKSFNDGWRFALGDEPEMSRKDFDDSSWRELTLPHDWAIEGDFSKDNPSGTGGGALPGGVGWYRKTFTLAPTDRDRKIFIDFDGAYMNSTVFINGHELGTRPYGYASFSYELTPWLDKEGENVVAVRVDNAEQPNSRWYSGCGIYRNVWLRSLSDVHIPLWGQHIATPEVTDSEAVIELTTELVNQGENPVAVSIYTALIDPEGVMTERTPAQTIRLDGNSSETTVKASINVKNPRLWSVETPQIYTLATFTDSYTHQTLPTILIQKI